MPPSPSRSPRPACLHTRSALSVPVPARTPPWTALHGMESCPFCRIREGALSAHVLYEDDEVLAFLDIYPCTEGHTLVVPRRHAASLTECPPATVAALFLAAVRL